MLYPLVSDHLMKRLPSDIVKHVIIPATFLKCRNCSKYMDWEEEKAARNGWCPNCMFSICSYGDCTTGDCTCKGTNEDFHADFWACEKGWVCKDHIWERSRVLIENRWRFGRIKGLEREVGYFDWIDKHWTETTKNCNCSQILLDSQKRKKRFFSSM